MQLNPCAILFISGTAYQVHTSTLYLAEGHCIESSRAGIAFAGTDYPSVMAHLRLSLLSYDPVAAKYQMVDKTSDYRRPVGHLLY